MPDPDINKIASGKPKVHGIIGNSHYTAKGCLCSIRSINGSEGDLDESVLDSTILGDANPE
jgi:hypothetical protein